MLENKWFPYIEKYINDYLHGFTKEQITIGVTNGVIKLEQLLIKPDAINNKWNEQHVPIWLKYGHIGNVQISCSLMNFIGEKPLDIKIENINIILTNSYLHWMRSSPNSINNNCTFKHIHSNITIYDQSYANATDSMSTMNPNKPQTEWIFDKCLKFIKMQTFAFNLTIDNIKIKYEDDIVFDDNAFIMILNRLTFHFSNQGRNKTGKYGLSNWEVYYKRSNIGTIPLNIWIDDFNMYYNIVKEWNMNSIYNIKNSQIVWNRCTIAGDFGNKESTNLSQKTNASADIYSMIIPEIQMNLFYSIDIDTLNISLSPKVVDSVFSIKGFFENYEWCRDWRRYRPRNITGSNWIKYLVWLCKFKKHKKENEIRKEFNKYLGANCANNIWTMYSINEAELNNNSMYLKEEIEEAYEYNIALKGKVIIRHIAIEILNNALTSSFIAKVTELEFNNMLTKDIIEADINAKHIQFWPNELFKSSNPDLPKFQYLSVDTFNKLQVEKANTQTKWSTPTVNNSTKKQYPSREFKNTIPNKRDSAFKNNATSYIPAGLKECSIHDNDNQALINSTIQVYKENARYHRRIQVLNSTLRLSNNINLSNKSNQQFQRLYNNQCIWKQPKQEIIKEIWTDVADINNQTYNCVTDNNNNSKTIIKAKQDMSVSKAIEDYNKQKNKVNAVNTWFHTHSVNNSNSNNNHSKDSDSSLMHKNSIVRSISPFYRNTYTNHNNFSLFNSKKSALKPKHQYDLPFVTITDTINWKYIYDKKIKNNHLIDIKFPDIRVNFFKEYIISIIKVAREYEISTNSLSSRPSKSASEKSIKSKSSGYVSNILTQNIRLKKGWYILHHYIYKAMIQKNKTSDKYFQYIKSLIWSYPIVQVDKTTFSSSFDFNFWFTYNFSNTYEWNISYNSFNFILYEHYIETLSEYVLSQVKIKNIDIKWYLSFNYWYCKVFDSEFEVNEYDNVLNILTEIVNEINSSVVMKIRKCVGNERLENIMEESRSNYINEKSKKNNLKKLERNLSNKDNNSDEQQYLDWNNKSCVILRACQFEINSNK